MVSPRLRKRYITAPHDTAAKRVKYLESGGSGFTPELASADCGEVLYPETALGIKDARTREAT